MKYRRGKAANATWFFTVNLADRSSELLVRHADVLRDAMRYVRRAHPFTTVALVIMPDHLHAVWRLPSGDADFPMRWSLIKAGFSRALPRIEAIGTSRLGKRERGIWQRRYWEHQIRDEDDLQRHVDYVHFNPVKHGHVQRAVEWRYSTIHRYIERGWLTPDWGTGIAQPGRYGE